MHNNTVVTLRYNGVVVGSVYIDMVYIPIFLDIWFLIVSPCKRLA